MNMPEMRSHRSTENDARAIRRVWTFGGILGVCLLASTWYCLTFRSAVARLDGDKARTESIFRYLGAKQRVYEQHVIAKTEYDGAARRNGQLAQRVGRSSDDIEFLSWASQEATRCGLSLDDYRPGSQISYGDYEGKSLHFSGKGSYESLCRLLDSLRTCPRMNRIVSLDVMPVDTDRMTFTFTMRIDLLSTSADNSSVATVR